MGFFEGLLERVKTPEQALAMLKTIGLNVKFTSMEAAEGMQAALREGEKPGAKCAEVRGVFRGQPVFALLILSE